MKIMPTLEGGLRMDIEDPSDWHLLIGITHDAVSCDKPLADRLGNLITEDEVADDWKEFVVPDLDEGFSTALSDVATAIASARLESGGGPGPLWITREDGFSWYSALNQARLALEEQYHFGPGEDVDPAKLPLDRRSPFLRSQFYCAIQSLLLDHVMG